VLSSIDRIARSVMVPLDDLLRLKRLHTARDWQDVLSELEKSFDKSKLAVGAHTLDGVILWGNRRMRALHDDLYPETPFDILNLLPTPARETFKFQVDCERRGVVQPYINVTQNKAGENLCRHYYPTNICTGRMPEPQFNVVYAASSAEDTLANYDEFCRQLLECVLPEHSGAV
jgi:hypothetical protein